MNKKFSTFLAGVALFGAMNVNAADDPVVLVEGNNKPLYQLKTAENVYLIMNSEDGTLSGATTIDDTNLQNSLWCVKVTTYNNGKAPIYDFQNKATGEMLNFDMENLTFEDKESNVAPEVGGDIEGWAFSTTFAAPTGVQTEQKLYSYFKTDSVLSIKVDGEDVTLVKELASDVKEGSDFTLTVADPMILTAPQINTILGMQAADKGVALTFTPDESGEKVKVANPFNGKNAGKFLAAEIDGDADGYVYVLTTDSSYLRVDTTIVNASGERFRAFAWSDLKYATLQKSKAATKPATAADSIEASVLKDQYKFAFTYYPTNDSLVIQVKNAKMYDPENGADGSQWVDGTESTLLTIDGDPGENNFVSVQDLIKDKVRIVTIYDKKETDISFGFAGCEDAASDKTSVADGLYYIRNDKGQYLVNPIYINTNAYIGRYPMWLTINEEEQDLAHMPACQWVVLKKRTNPAVAATSPVSISNREFSCAESLNSIQLYKVENSEYLTAELKINEDSYDADWAYVTEMLAGKNNKIKFIPAGAEAYNDSLLGYKNLTKEDLMITNYAFQYLHPYNDDKYIGLVEGDTTLHVMDETPSLFGLEATEVDENGQTISYQYGFPVDEEIQKRIPGLTNLYRASYRIYTYNEKNEKVYVVKTPEAGYALSARPVGLKQLGFGLGLPFEEYFAPCEFLFKENYHVNNTHYYALIEHLSVLYSKPNPGVPSTVPVYVADMLKEYDEDYIKLCEYRSMFCFRVGVDDHGLHAPLQVQPNIETRISTFSIAPANEPLYRRFNSFKLEGNEGDASDTLRFVEKYRREYLMDESNASFKVDGIDFLGIWTADKATGLSFNVDTAWVNRGYGYIKPQYLISVDRHDVMTAAGIPCDASNHKHVDATGKETDAAHCVHATPAKAGFAYGKYLVSFADSTDAAYSWKGYSRVGFVKAIHSGDSLYILVNGFENKDPKDLVIADIIKAYEDAGINETYIKNLQGDKHKTVTWSFRYIDPKVAANEVEEDRSFLIESMAAAGEPAIAPNKASWLKMQNGCLVLSDYSVSTFDHAKTGGDDALIFNIEVGNAEDFATDNETIATSEIAVIAGEGNVTIAGAAGKKVVITNILGQTIANTVLTSDNAVIAAPQGVVVIAVEGEEAVKAIVK